jgi:hypothetical protein
MNLIIVIFCGLIANIYMIATADNDSIFDGMLLFLVFIIFSIACFSSIITDLKNYNNKLPNTNFKNTIVSLIVLVSFPLTECILILRDRSPIILEAGTFSDFNGASLVLREDGTYKFGNLSALGSNFIRGQFKMNDSIITLDQSNLDNIIKSQYLMIKETPSKDSIILQVNDRNEIIDVHFSLKIRLDNRNKNSNTKGKF